ncbi:MAG: efflux RND transporter permease subunit, partial [Chitinophagaceae bacterium]
GLVANMADIENIVVKQIPNGTPVLIKNVADVTIGSAIRYGAMVYNNGQEVTGAIVMMLKGANSSKVIKNIKKRINIIEKTLPEGLVIEPFLDRTKMVNNAISTVEKNLLEGAIIVIFVLVLFLGNMRAGLLVASVIPLAMLFAIIMMNLFGVSGNLMSLGALDFGLLVDGAVIIVEAVLHQIHKHPVMANQLPYTQKEMDSMVESASKKMMNSAAFGQLIILIVYLPILSLQGIEGKMFKPMAQTVGFAILGALLLSLTYIPAISTLVLSKKRGYAPTFSDKMMDKITQAYLPALQKALLHPKKVILASLVAFIVTVVMLMQLGGEFIPKLEEGDFAVDTRLLSGSSLSATIEATGKAAGLLKEKFPEVEKVVTKIGSGDVPTDPMSLEASDMMVILKDKKEWTSAKSFDELAEKMSTVLANVPGISTGFQYPVQMRFNELMTGARQDVVVKVFGENLDTLASYAALIGNLASKIEGAKDLYIETVTGVPQLVVAYNRTAIAQYGANIADINTTIQAAYAGAITGQVFENEKRFDLVVRLDEATKQQAEELNNLLIGLPNGQQVPLNVLANVALVDGPYQILHEDAMRRIALGFNVRGRDVQTIVNELQDKIQKNIKFPPGYTVKYGGQYENLQHATQRLLIAVPIALFLIFVLLYFTFQKIKYGLLIFTAIPLSAIGGVAALYLRDMPFSISAGVGFIALFGVAVLNGIVLIAEMNEIKLQHSQLTMPEIITKATQIRLRPVLMTALVASLGFLPMAISNGAGAEVQRPLATVVIGGLITATLLTLLVLPCLYLLFETKIVFTKKAFQKHV